MTNTREGDSCDEGSASFCMLTASWKRLPWSVVVHDPPGGWGERGEGVRDAQSVLNRGERLGVAETGDLALLGGS